MRRLHYRARWSNLADVNKVLTWWTFKFIKRESVLGGPDLIR